jgi:predicted DNA-binding transcriptional regulator YafY
MNRFDRALAILLLLRDGRSWSASALAARLEVSPRTIYRDIETLGAVGVPVYAELGRNGGFRLMDGYFLPPISFAPDEAVSLLLGMTLLRSLRARPFAAALETGERKLLAAMPDTLRVTLAEARTVVGFEGAIGDAFHPEPPRPPAGSAGETQPGTEERAIDTFLRAILEGRTLTLDYRSPYRPEPARLTIIPRGMFWDRDRWYLVGRRAEHPGEIRLWRADRVVALAPGERVPGAEPAFDVRSLLGHGWLREAMVTWRAEAPVAIRLTRRQAERLSGDWYFRHATYEERGPNAVLLTFGESDRALVFALLRWLGPGAELIAPAEWRAPFTEELRRMATTYEGDGA